MIPILTFQLLELSEYVAKNESFKLKVEHTFNIVQRCPESHIFYWAKNKATFLRDDPFHIARQQWAWEHYEGIPVCVDCAKMVDCALSPTSSCSLIIKKESEAE